GLREDEVAARSLGKPTPGLKLKAFVVGGVLAGVAGSLWAHWIGAVHVGQFVPIVTFNVWLAMLLGGVGNHVGVLLGALLLVVIREATRFLGLIPGLGELAARRPTLLPSLRFVIIGLLLVLVVRFAPNGVIPERLRVRGVEQR
ncbi:MAG: branched-chain amino acid ABC transporter permease, partial [Actinomycetota bacterium]|nr:branched-chain amino acid ABC transporter permease [Actinomycetota bacterium]